MKLWYSIDGLFQEDYFFYFFNKKGVDIVNRLPDLEYRFTKYKKLLKKTALHPINVTSVQIFTKEIGIDENNYYNISWNIDLISKIIRQHNIPAQTLPINNLINNVVRNELNTDHLPIALKNKSPIIIVHFPVIPDSLIVVDGNHRVASKYYTKKDSIEGFIIPHSLHLLAMCSPIHRILYYIHHNLNWFSEYIAGYSTLSDIQSKLVPLEELTDVS